MSDINNIIVMVYLLLFISSLNIILTCKCYLKCYLTSKFYLYVIVYINIMAQSILKVQNLKIKLMYVGTDKI